MLICFRDLNDDRKIQQFKRIKEIFTNQTLSMTFVENSDFDYFLSMPQEELPSFENIKIINFYLFKINQQNAINLAYFLEKNSIWKLDLGEFETNYANANSLDMICFAIKDKLKFFSINIKPSPNDLLTKIFTPIAFFRSLETLEIKVQNDSTPELCLSKLAEIIKFNKNLKYLFLKFEGISLIALPKIFKELSDKIQKFQIHINKSPEIKWELFDDFGDLNLKNLKELNISANPINDKLLLQMRDLTSLTYEKFNTYENFLTLIEAIKSNESLQSLTISPMIISNDQLLRKFLHALELSVGIKYCRFEPKHDEYAFIDNENKVIGITKNIFDNDSSDKFKKLYLNYHLALSKSLEHNYNLLCYYVNYQYCEIGESKEKLNRIFTRNKSFSEQFRQDLSSFKSELVKKLSPNIDDEDQLERAIEVTNAVIDYFILPNTKDEKSSRLNEIFTQFSNIKFDITVNFKNDLSEFLFMLHKAIIDDSKIPKLSTLSLNQIILKTLSDKSTTGIQYRKNLQSLNLEDQEIKLITNHLFSFCDKSIKDLTLSKTNIYSETNASLASEIMPLQSDFADQSWLETSFEIPAQEDHSQEDLLNKDQVEIEIDSQVQESQISSLQNQDNEDIGEENKSSEEIMPLQSDFVDQSWLETSFEIPAQKDHSREDLLNKDQLKIEMDLQVQQSPISSLRNQDNEGIGEENNSSEILNSYEIKTSLSSPEASPSNLKSKGLARVIKKCCLIS